MQNLLIQIVQTALTVLYLSWIPWEVFHSHWTLVHPCILTEFFKRFFSWQCWYLHYAALFLKDVSSNHHSNLGLLFGFWLHFSISCNNSVYIYVTLSGSMIAMGQVRYDYNCQFFFVASEYTFEKWHWLLCFCQAMIVAAAFNLNKAKALKKCTVVFHNPLAPPSFSSFPVVLFFHIYHRNGVAHVEFYSKTINTSADWARKGSSLAL